jgi:ribosomal protein S18 acetylase RimI-like enzyme
LITVRKARPSDNEALLDIQTRSPQGTDFVLGTDSSPDYFNRTRPYEDGHVFVAEEDGQVVGASSCAFLETVVSGVPCKAVYGYGLMVDPDHRRKGIATQLNREGTSYIDERGVDLRFVVIIEGNVPSINLVNKLGYTLLHDFLRVSVMMHKGQAPAHPEHIRCMEKADAGDVVELLNEYYRGYDLYVPFTVESLLAEIERYPFFSLEDIHLYVDEDGLQACLGCWDYNKITRYSVLKMPQEMKEQAIANKAPFIPELGMIFSMYFSHYPAYRAEEAFMDLLMHANEVLRGRRVHYITVPVNAGTPMHELLVRFPHVVSNTHLYVKPSEGNEFPDLGKNKVYIDPAHL